MAMMNDSKQKFSDEAVAFSKNYSHSSFRDYLGEKRPQNSVLSPITFEP
jgi:hypothetical protein